MRKSINWRRISFVFCLLFSLGHPTAATAAAYTLPENGDSLVGAVTTLRLVYEDSFASVAQKYAIGYQELIDANPGVDPWIPGADTVIKIPTEYVLPDAPRDGLVINVAEYRLYYYPPGGKRVITYPVGIGRTEFPTPLIQTKVVGRIENPSWTPTASARKEHAEMGDILPAVVPPGPDNPLGSLAIQLAAPGYFIHGTNKPFGVGQMVSHGCIRLYDPHIATLAEMMPRGTPVYIVNQPFKVGWRREGLYVESHEDLYAESDRSLLQGLIEKATQQKAASVDWRQLDSVLQDRTGIPVKIQSISQNAPTADAVRANQDYFLEQQVSATR
jgi:L,D-transpeptidase ErfK/SrfK